MKDAQRSLYQQLLRESTERPSSYPMLHHYVKNGIHSMGCAFRFRYLQRKYTRDYEKLTLEKRGQEKLF